MPVHHAYFGKGVVKQGKSVHAEAIVRGLLLRGWKGRFASHVQRMKFASRPELDRFTEELVALRKALLYMVSRYQDMLRKFGKTETEIQESVSIDLPLTMRNLEFLNVMASNLGVEGETGTGVAFLAAIPWVVTVSVIGITTWLVVGKIGGAIVQAADRFTQDHQVDVHRKVMALNDEIGVIKVKIQAEKDSPSWFGPSVEQMEVDVKDKERVIAQYREDLSKGQWQRSVVPIAVMFTIGYVIFQFGKGTGGIGAQFGKVLTGMAAAVRKLLTVETRGRPKGSKTKKKK